MLKMMELLSATSPVVMIGGPVSVERITFTESPCTPFTVSVRTRTTDAAPGEKMSVTSQAGSFNGIISQVREDHTPESSAIEIVAEVPSSSLEEPHTVCHVEKSREWLLKAFAPAKKADAGVASEIRDQFVLLDSKSLIPAMRLALFGRLMVLHTESGIQHVDPAKNKPARKIDRFDCLRRERSGVPSIQFSSPDWDKPGDRLKHRQKGSHSKAAEIAAFFPDAVSVGELKAAGQLIEAVERVGDFMINGGLALAGIEPGSWIKPKKQKLLVTGRVRSWTPRGGWSVQLQGGYPWEALLEPIPAAAPDYGKVIDLDDKTGKLRIKLSCGIEVIAPWISTRANASEYVGGVPAKGDTGIILYRYGSASHPVYLGSEVPPNVLTKEEFDRIVHLSRSGEYEERMTSEGEFQQRGKLIRSEFDQNHFAGKKFSGEVEKFEWKKKS